MDDISDHGSFYLGLLTFSESGEISGRVRISFKMLAGHEASMPWPESIRLIYASVRRKAEEINLRATDVRKQAAAYEHVIETNT
jgi:hypothetical protein